jgi:hypothetical protein
MGLAILGANAESNADIQLSEDDKGKILRLALDDAIRKSLPKIDKFLRNQPAKGMTAESGAPAPATPVTPSAATAVPQAVPNSNNAVQAAQKFCPQCGAANAADAKFCAKCGAKLN